jgi:exoribonuclease-2
MRKRSPLQEDRRFIQDIESLALGKSAKSRTMKEIGLGETPEEAHALLLECGFWNVRNNPHPARFNVSLQPAEYKPEAPPQEERRGLTHLAAFAIDSPWSNDPDDAVSIELEDGKQTLYVHVADPASSIGADSPAEREARDRGATLYIPEGSIRMLADEALPLFALGLAETSPALTFKMTLNDTGEIEKTEIFASMVKVTRLTYEKADEYLNDTHGDISAALLSLNALAERNIKRRGVLGAINIDMPETHISLNGDRVEIEPVTRYKSADMVRECMLLAGEGAGVWAMQRSLPVPYIMQETGDLPEETLSGMAGYYQLRRCMRTRALSTKPGRHSGLGLDTYIQVTSPLRRYTDLLAHLQIRAVLRGKTPLDADEVSARMNAGEAAMSAVSQAERASRSHWTIVYLAGKTDSVWDATALEKKGNRWAVIIPSLALETQVPLRKELSPNEPLKLVLKSVNIPCGEAVFAAVE